MPPLTKRLDVTIVSLGTLGRLSLSKAELRETNCLAWSSDFQIKFPMADVDFENVIASDSGMSPRVKKNILYADTADVVIVLSRLYNGTLFDIKFSKFLVHSCCSEILTEVMIKIMVAPVRMLRAKLLRIYSSR